MNRSKPTSKLDALLRRRRIEFLNDGDSDDDGDTIPFSGKNIALFFDGTWNICESNTNVWRLYEMTADTTKQGVRQEKFYCDGVGTTPYSRIKRALGGLFGLGFDENVRRSYRWLMKTYKTGDRVFIFGFSRGAYTARALASLIENCGMMYLGSPISVEQLHDRCVRINKGIEDEANVGFWMKLPARLNDQCPDGFWSSCFGVWMLLNLFKWLPSPILGLMLYLAPSLSSAGLMFAAIASYYTLICMVLGWFVCRYLGQSWTIPPFKQGTRTIRQIYSSLDHEMSVRSSRATADESSPEQCNDRCTDLCCRTSKFSRDDDDSTISKNHVLFGIEERRLQKYSRPIKLRFMGMFDTVASVGLSLIPGIKGISSDEVEQWHDVHLTNSLENIYHALAIDEHRKGFKPTMFAKSATCDRDKAYDKMNIQQRWFIGSHSQVGGGFRNDPLSDIPLQWIQQNAKKYGLSFKTEIIAEKTSFLAPIQDSHRGFIIGIYGIGSLKYDRPISHRPTSCNEEKEHSRSPKTLPQRAIQSIDSVLRRPLSGLLLKFLSKQPNPDFERRTFPNCYIDSSVIQRYQWTKWTHPGDKYEPKALLDWVGRVNRDGRDEEWRIDLSRLPSHCILSVQDPTPYDVESHVQRSASLRDMDHTWFLVVSKDLERMLWLYFNDLVASQLHRYGLGQLELWGMQPGYTQGMTRENQTSSFFNGLNNEPNACYKRFCKGVWDWIEGLFSHTSGQQEEAIIFQVKRVNSRCQRDHVEFKKQASVDTPAAESGPDPASVMSFIQKLLEGYLEAVSDETTYYHAPESCCKVIAYLVKTESEVQPTMNEEEALAFFTEWASKSTAMTGPTRPSPEVPIASTATTTPSRIPEQEITNKVTTDGSSTKKGSSPMTTNKPSNRTRPRPQRFWPTGMRLASAKPVRFSEPPAGKMVEELIWEFFKEQVVCELHRNGVGQLMVWVRAGNDDDPLTMTTAERETENIFNGWTEKDAYDFFCEMVWCWIQLFVSSKDGKAASRLLRMFHNKFTVEKPRGRYKTDAPFLLMHKDGGDCLSSIDPEPEKVVAFIQRLLQKWLDVVKHGDSADLYAPVELQHLIASQLMSRSATLRAMSEEEAFSFFVKWTSQSMAARLSSSTLLLMEQSPTTNVAQVVQRSEPQ